MRGCAVGACAEEEVDQPSVFARRTHARPHASLPPPLPPLLLLPLPHALTAPPRDYAGAPKTGGSFWGSVFNLLNAAVGAGVLALPSCIQSVGLLLGVAIATALAMLLY